RLRGMCRSIKTLRPPFADDVSEDDMRAAALQYVRKVSGMRTPSRANAEVFDQAVEAVSSATRDLLDQIRVGQRSAAPQAAREPAGASGRRAAGR
ncbi:MAG TPA: DUF2277 domain-containing protein, partial [Candidatus Eisenbacteria bacterium]|nr:DUF2277 domain-containing protein [Candidatus Eisenbacteria bacterium]